MKRIFSAGWMVLLCGCFEIGGGDPPFNPVDPQGGAQDIICEAELSLTGSLAAAATPDDCIPTGTWTVNVTVADDGGCEDIDIAGTYVYEVTGDQEVGYTYTFPNDPDNENILLKVSSVGASCQGDFKHYSDDAMTVIVLKPFEEDLALSGSGTYTVASGPQI